MKRKPVQKPTQSTKKLSARGILHRYFEKKKGQSATGFLEEIKALTDAEQLDLAQDVACTMGLTQSQVQFDLK